MTTRAGERVHVGWDVWFQWLLASSLGFGIGIAVNGAAGDVVGEALGGAVLHTLFHVVGTVLFGGIVAHFQWLVLQRWVPWANQWAQATIAGYVFIGCTRVRPSAPARG